MTGDAMWKPLPRQRDAIEAPLGPTLVVAGPGAGKTFCLIGRIGYLVQHTRIEPARICAVTFTNKAAEEIAVRLRATLGVAAEEVTRGTLHALCVDVLRRHGETMGIAPGFGIADEEYQGAVLRSFGIHRKQRRWLLEQFGRRRLKNEHLEPDDDVLFRRYVEALRRRSMLDFDDLVWLTSDLFCQKPDIADRVASRWDYVLVDELQDLNASQFAIVKSLVAGHRNVFGVGDDEQSIFAWTGADPMVLRRFQDELGVEAPIVLDENHRCSDEIFSAAQRLLRHNPSLFDKQIRTHRSTGVPVRAQRFPDDAAEAAWVVDAIMRERRDENLGWGHFAVLYRTHRVGAGVEREFLREGVPCRLARGRALRDNAIVATVVASLRVVRQPDDPFVVEGLARRFLPDAFFEAVRDDAHRGGVLFATALQTHARQLGKSHPDARRAWRFIYHLENLRALGEQHTSVSNLVHEILSQRVGKYRNPLEEVHEDLGDPIQNERAVELSRRLGEVADSGGRIWVEPQRGLEIALRGMLLGAGYPAVEYLDQQGNPQSGDLILRAAGAGLEGAAVELFKALQCRAGRDFADGFEDFVAFDLETTDLDVEACGIVEIAAVRVRGGAVADRFHSLARPSRPVSARAAEVHGYSTDDLDGQPRFAEVWPRFRAFVGEDLLVAHNARQFDIPVLLREAHGLPGCEGLRFFDSLPLARSLFDHGARLTDLATRFGIEMGRAHHALDDSIALARVFVELGAQKLARARKASMAHLLDWAGLAIVLDPRFRGTLEQRTLLEAARPAALGRFSNALEFYVGERERLAAHRSPTPEDVIERLGGRALMDRLRTSRTASDRYPEIMAQLDVLLEESTRDELGSSIDALLERIALSSSDGVDLDPERVNLLTLHATKGLEFPRVIIVGVEDHEIPGYYATVHGREDEIEEARRLLYVGMTRAQDRLTLTRVDRRAGRDAGGSRFLEEMGLA